MCQPVSQWPQLSPLPTHPSFRLVAPSLSVLLFFRSLLFAVSTVFAAPYYYRTTFALQLLQLRVIFAAFCSVNTAALLLILVVDFHSFISSSSIDL